MFQSLDLTDPLIAHRYMVAMRVLHELPGFDWYDSQFLAKFEAARQMLEIVNPASAPAFTAAFDVLRTSPDFKVRHVRPLLSDAHFENLLAEVRALPPKALKSRENAQFGRDIFHDLPALGVLQRELTPLVSELAGEEVEPCYNFLSLYHGGGRCPPHMDAPSAKWTLDLCLAQSCEWPIRFSDIVPWPTAGEAATVSDETDPALLGIVFEDHILHPNEALLFSGSSQWHYRDSIPDSGFCHLAFLHYHPAGCADLIDPARWATRFDLPELAVLDAVFDAMRPVAQ